jgi:putative proteasome-type protease
MTYCVGIKLNAGLVFLSDSRTNAGVDHISTFRKMIVYEQPGDRVMVLLSSGNLSISQSVREILQIEELRETREDGTQGDPITIWNAKSMFDAARVLGSAVRHVYDRDAEALKHAGLDFNVSFIFGGQVKGEGMRLFLVYAAGNFIEATTETPYFQVGESKYGKPVLDRVLTPETPLDEAAKCALVSMDSTMKSNLSVGLPLDLVVYEANKLETDRVICIDADNPYYRMMHNSWGQKLREVFDSIEDPVWDDSHRASAEDAGHAAQPAAQDLHARRKAHLSAVSAMAMPPVIFSHGNSFPASTYRVVLDSLRNRGFEVDAIEKFGHDPKYPVTDNWPHLVQQLADFAQLRADRAGGPVFLIGHSLGGFLSLMCAALHPTLAKRRGADRLAHPRRLARQHAERGQAHAAHEEHFARRHQPQAPQQLGAPRGGVRAFPQQEGVREVGRAGAARLHRPRHLRR